MISDNVFKGKKGVHDFLNPKNHVTPLVEIPEELNPFYNDEVHVFVKMLSFTPLMNVKSIPSYNMLDKHKKLEEYNIIENSSGNTAFSLSILSKIFGFKKTRVLISAKDTSIGKLQMLLLSGAEVQANNEPLCPDPSDLNSGIQIAKNMGKRKKWFNPNQYSNKNNPESHYKITAPQIYEQLNGDIQIFSTGLGTTGSMVGCAKYLKEKLPNLKISGIVRKPNNIISGPRTLGLLRMIDFDWKKDIDEIIDVSTYDSYLRSLELCRSGLLLGPSSGFNLAGTLKYIMKLKRNNLLDKIRNKQGRINVVFIGCDSPFPYLDTYFKCLPRNKFPKIINEELLIAENKITFNYSKENKKISISPQKTIKTIYESSTSKFKSMDINTRNIIVDVRNNDKFVHSRLPNSVNILEDELINNHQKYLTKWEGRRVLFYCEYGELSYLIAKYYANKGIDSYSLLEGFVKWSDLDLPRVSDICKCDLKLKNKKS
ncbi:MAG: pyridoxal-phosphate dependent enzyme [Alphaproteobacteria bacterium]|jgi:cysteine synthase A|nr:pyridoxal-phosphate dependent enzyme [Alphaproteobacteria bacterium]